MNLCIVIPVLNEEVFIESHSKNLLSLTDTANVIFVDGGSTDRTVPLLRAHQFKIFQTNQSGRGSQLHAGLMQLNSSCEIILFLHVDTQLPENYLVHIKDTLRTHAWGRFNVKIKSSKTIFRIIETLMNIRSCITGIATGDQAIFVKVDFAVEKLQQLSDYPLMEDIYMSKQLKTVSHPACIKTPVHTSARYWEKNGIFKTILTMWRYRLLFFLGVTPAKLFKKYYS